MNIIYYIIKIETNRYNPNLRLFQHVLAQFNTVIACYKGGICLAVCEDTDKKSKFTEYQNENEHRYESVTIIHENSEKSLLIDILKTFDGESIIDNTGGSTSKMLMPKQNRVSIYEYLFKEGVMVAKKDYHAPKHPDLEKIPNLQVIKAMQSLKSRGYVKEQFAWRHFYWYLTNEGIEYLRIFLHLPPEIVPATLKRSARTETVRRGAVGRPEGPARAAEDRSGYRRAPTTPGAPHDKKADVGPGSADVEFRGGFGRGRPAP